MISLRRHKTFPAGGRLARPCVTGPALTLCAVVLLAATGCDRWSGDEPGGETLSPSLPELPRVAEIVRETRAILPRVPAVELPAPQAAPAEAAPARPVLQGTASLIRRGPTAGLPAQLSVTLYLGPEHAPGGYLEVTPTGGLPERWALLGGQREGERAGNFFQVHRVRDTENRLRLFALLGSLYEAEGKRFRAFEGYLIIPGRQGALGSEQPRYAVDFGYRWPEPPAAVVQATALMERFHNLERLLSAWDEVLAGVAAAEKTLAALRTAQVPPEQEPRRARDLAEWRGRRADLEGRRADLAGQLEAGLRTAYSERRLVAEAWVHLTGTNPYRWRTLAARRDLYAPLAALARRAAVLERVFATLPPKARAGLNPHRADLDSALLREAETLPAPPTR